MGTRPTNPTEAEPRLFKNRYRIERRLASGAFGVVYKGSYTIMGEQKPVAIKLLKGRAEVDQSTAVRFRQEIQTLLQLDDPNICKVLDGDVESDGTMFLVMEYAEGGNLREKLKDAPGGRIDWQIALRWLEESARGLLAAEKNLDDRTGKPAPVFHRDVKPENLLLQRGRVVVADFGAAKLGGDNPGVTSALVPALWTPAYGSPEQSGGYADHLSDIYSLGSSFYHLLTGNQTKHRFRDEEERLRVAHDPSIVCADVPKALGRIVRRMTEPASKDRYQSFREVLDDVASMRQRPVPKWPMRVLAGLLVAAATVGGLEYAGVTDWFDSAVRVDRGDRPLGEVLAELEQLQQQVAGLRLADPQGLKRLAGEIERVDGQLKRNRALADALVEELGKLRGSVPDAEAPLQQYVLPPKFVPLRRLADSIEELQQRVPAHTAVRLAVRKLATAVEDGGGTSDVPEQLETLRGEVRKLAFGAELQERLEDIRSRDDELRRESRQRVAALERAFEAGLLRGLAGRAEAAAAQLEQLGEDELLATARGVRDGAKAARRLVEAGMPVWQATARPLNSLGQLAIELERLEELEAAADDAVRPWLAARASVSRREWGGKASAAWGEATADWQRLVRDFDARVEAARNAGRALDSFVAERESLASRRQQLLAAKTLLRTISPRLRHDPLAYALQNEVEPPAPIAAAPVDDLAYYTELRDDRRYAVARSARDPSLGEPVQQLSVVDADFRRLLADVEGRARTARDWKLLSESAEQLNEARRRFDSAQQLLGAIEAAEVAFAATSVEALRRVCRPFAGGAAFTRLEERRAAFARRVADEALRREQLVTGLRDRFAAGAVDLAGLAADLQAVRKGLERAGEDAAVSRLDALAGRLERAEQVPLPVWSPASGGCSVVEMQRFIDRVAALAEIDVGLPPGQGGVPSGQSDRLLARWWSARREALLQSWWQLWTPRWAELDTMVRRAAAAAPTRPGAERSRCQSLCDSYKKALIGLKSLALPDVRMLLAASPLSTRALPALPAEVLGGADAELFGEAPEGWPDASFGVPAGITLRSVVVEPSNGAAAGLYRADALELLAAPAPASASPASAAAASPLRLWHVEGRTDKDGRPIYMVFAKSADGARAALIDVHPVTFAEIKQRRYINGWRYWKRTSYERKPVATIAYNFSRKYALQFGERVGEKVGADVFVLPPADFMKWPAAASLRPMADSVPQSDSVPQIELPTMDVSVGGLTYLRRGLREWVAAGDPIGVSEMVWERLPQPVQRDAGFRLAIVLRERP
ncbi:MAG: protein kinase [Planctomycetota bacterium]